MSRDERGRIPNTALRVTVRPCCASLANRAGRLVAPAMADELVECTPACHVQRSREQQTPHRARIRATSSDNARSSSSTCSTISRLQTRSNAPSGNGSDITEPAATLAPRARSLVSAVVLISTKCVPSIGRRGRNPGATSSRRGACADQRLHQRPGIEALGLYQPGLRPERIVEQPVRTQQLGVVACCSTARENSRVMSLRFADHRGTSGSRMWGANACAGSGVKSYGCARRMPTSCSAGKERGSGL